MWQIIKGFLYHNIEPLYQVFLLKDLIYRRMKMRWVIQTNYWHLHKDIINKSSIKSIITFILSHHPQKPPHPRCYEPDHNIRYPFILECRECDWCGTMSVCTLKRSNAGTAATHWSIWVTLSKWTGHAEDSQTSSYIYLYITEPIYIKLIIKNTILFYILILRNIGARKT